MNSLPNYPAMGMSDAPLPADFGGAPIMVSQYFDLLRSTCDSGLKKLHLAVLERTLVDLGSAVRTRRPGMTAACRDWLLTPYDAPFSFETVCEVLSINATWLRGGIVAWLENTGGRRLQRRSAVNAGIREQRIALPAKRVRRPRAS